MGDVTAGGRVWSRGGTKGSAGECGGHGGPRGSWTARGGGHARRADRAWAGATRQLSRSAASGRHLQAGTFRRASSGRPFRAAPSTGAHKKKPPSAAASPHGGCRRRGRLSWLSEDQLWPNLRCFRWETCSEIACTVSWAAVGCVCSFVSGAVLRSWPPVRAPRFCRLCFLPTIVPPVADLGRWAITRLACG